MDATTMALDARSDEDLVRAWRRQKASKTGDELFAEVVRRYQDRVFRLALSVLGPGSEAAAEDVAQEVFLRIYRRISSFRSESRFSSWLYRIAYNAALNERRRPRWQRPHVPEAVLEAIAGEGGGGDDSLSVEGRRCLYAAIDILSPTQRSAVLLHYWLGEEIEGIAELLRRRPGTVKSDLHRARRALAKHLEASS